VSGIEMRQHRLFKRCELRWLSVIGEGYGGRLYPVTKPDQGVPWPGAARK